MGYELYSTFSSIGLQLQLVCCAVKTTRMKLLLILTLCAVAAAAPKIGKDIQDNFDLNIINHDTPEERNILVNALVRQLFEFVRRILKNGWAEQGIPPLDPLNLDKFHLVVPAEIINLDLHLENIHATGFGGFVVHRSNLNIRDLTFEVDISIPTIDLSTEQYDLIGDLFTAIPLYGKGKAEFKVDTLRFQAKLYLKQSEDEKSVIIDRIENVAFVVTDFKSGLNGVIGGGDIDAVVNAMAEDVIFGYVNRFHGAISKVAGQLAKTILNQLLDGLDTWRFIAVLLPR